MSDDTSALTPHGPGFSFLDEIVSVDTEQKKLIGQKRLDPSLPFFADHFPGQPLMPGVLLIEAAAQAAGALIGASRSSDSQERYFLAQVSDFRLRRPVLPGQVLEIEVSQEKDFGSLVSFNSVLKVAGNVVAKGRLTLNTG